MNSNRCSLSKLPLAALARHLLCAIASISSVGHLVHVFVAAFGSGCTVSFTWPYWPRPPVCLMYFPSPSASFKIVSRYATCGRPTLACTLNSRIMRSTMISRCSSPIPEINV